MICPKPKECVLEISLNGKVHCQVHDEYPEIDESAGDWGETVPMRHVLYVASTSPRGAGYVQIDEEQ